MAQKILVYFALVVLVLFLIEVVALLWLKNSVNRYSEFWKNQSTEGEFVYVALGDSTAQAIGATQPERGYVGQLASRIEQKTGKKVRIVNLSVSGATIKDVLDKQLPLLDDYKPDLVTVEVGGNDVVKNADPTELAKHIDKLIGQLPKNAVIANLPYFGGRIRKNEQAVAIGKQIESIAAKHGVPMVDLQTETKSKDSILNYSVDLFHPSNRAYNIWTDTFWQSIEPTLIQ